MAARTDHDRRDAQHAARAAIAVAFGRYIRRATEMAYAHIEEEATRDRTDDVDWSAVGAAAAHRAIASFGAGALEPAIEGTVSAVTAGDAAAGDT